MGWGFFIKAGDQSLNQRHKTSIFQSICDCSQLDGSSQLILAALKSLSRVGLGRRSSRNFRAIDTYICSFHVFKSVLT